MFNSNGGGGQDRKKHVVNVKDRQKGSEKKVLSKGQKPQAEMNGPAGGCRFKTRFHYKRKVPKQGKKKKKKKWAG